MSQQSPSYIALSELYINGCNLTWLSNTTLRVSSGIARDSTNIFDMINKVDLTINTALQGANGLDVGTIAANSWYAVYLIFDTTRQIPAAAILSLSSVNPTMPSVNNVTYSAFRRIGWAKTDGSSNLSIFIQSGNQIRRNYQWDSTKSVLSGGNATTFTAFSLAAGAPPQVSPVKLIMQYTPANAANTTSLRPTGSSVGAAFSPVLLKSSAAVQMTIPSIEIIPGLSSGNASLDYVVTASDSLNISVSGFVDNL